MIIEEINYHNGEILLFYNKDNFVNLLNEVFIYIFHRIFIQINVLITIILFSNTKNIMSTKNTFSFQELNFFNFEMVLVYRQLVTRM